MTLMHLYFAIATILGLAGFALSVRIIALRHLRIGGYVRCGGAALILGVACLLCSGLIFNYGLINLLSPPPDIRKGLLLMALVIGLLGGSGLALAEVVHTFLPCRRE